MRRFFRHEAKPAPSAAAMLTGDLACSMSGWGGHRWVRTWSLKSQETVLLKVDVEIDESDPTSVEVAVDAEVVANEVPPWVRHNERFERIDAETDARERSEYFGKTFAAIETAV